MKTLLIIVLATATVGLATIYFVQTRKSATQQAQLAALQAQVDDYETQVQNFKNANKYSEKQNTALAKAVQTMSADLQKAQAAQTNLGPSMMAKLAALGGTNKPDAEGAGLGKLLGTMMKDPDMKKFIRDQQRLQMDQLYAPLVKKMGLTPEEAERFKDLMSDHAMQGAEKATSLFGGLSATNRAELVNTLSEQQKQQEEAMKSFLGDTRYEQYKDYQQTAGDRMMLNMFRQQNPGESALTDPQTEQLLAIMKEEKLAVASATGQAFPGAGNDPEKMQAMFSEEQGDKLLQAQETVNQKVYDRAATILTPEQLQSFARFQTNQMQMLRMGMTMARKFMGGDKTP